ncbi:MAG: ArnT family glycosyltransferase [Thermoanaerobaculia bacterium]
MVSDGRLPLTAHRGEPGEKPRLETWLFLFALAVYAATRLVGLPQFPIFFFTDEAIQANLAAQLLENSGRDHTGTFLPPYFLNDQRWALSLSVYVHVLPVALFGKSIAAVRGTSVAVTILGVIATSLLLRHVLRNRFWWAAPLIFAVMPVFFLHSRTGFEAVMMASFYACFLWAYLLYRYRSPRYILVALLFGAATFYAYTAGQGLMLVTGVLLLFSDGRYHARQSPRLIAAAALLALLLATPYVRYRRLHPGVVKEQLAVLDSYWIKPLPLSEKLGQFGRAYLEGLDPRYWFLPNERELMRHRMKDMPYVPLVFAPLTALGIAVCVARFRRSPAHRAILFSPLGVPFAAAAANIQILRLLAMVVPVALFVAIGGDALFEWVRRRVRRQLSFAPVALACAAALSTGAARLTAVALNEGPTWYRLYGLYGMQYGAPQLFRAIREELSGSSRWRLIVTPTWANYPNRFAEFFLTPAERDRVAFDSLEGYATFKQPIEADGLFVVTQPELEEAMATGKFVLSPPERVVPYPDGTPGFLFVRVRYVKDIDAILAAEKAARARLVEASALFNGERVTVRHSMLDMGSVQDIVDGREQTLIRGIEANPFVVEIAFPRPRRVQVVRATLAHMKNALVAVEATGAGGDRVRSEAPYRSASGPPRFELILPRPVTAARLRLEIRDLTVGEPTHVHLYEIELQ